MSDGDKHDCDCWDGDSREYDDIPDVDEVENKAAEQIAAWLLDHRNDMEYRQDIDEPEEFSSVTKLAAAIREGRWRK